MNPRETLEMTCRKLLFAIRDPNSQPWVFRGDGLLGVACSLGPHINMSRPGKKTADHHQIQVGKGILLIPKRTCTIHVMYMFNVDHIHIMIMYFAGVPPIDTSALSYHVYVSKTNLISCVHLFWHVLSSRHPVHFKPHVLPFNLRPSVG